MRKPSLQQRSPHYSGAWRYEVRGMLSNMWKGRRYITVCAEVLKAGDWEHQVTNGV